MKKVLIAKSYAFEKKENVLQELKMAIAQGFESGVATNFNADEHLKSLKAKRES